MIIMYQMSRSDKYILTERNKKFYYLKRQKIPPLTNVEKTKIMSGNISLYFRCSFAVWAVAVFLLDIKYQIG